MSRAWVIAIAVAAAACSARGPAGPSLVEPTDDAGVPDAGVPDDAGTQPGPSDGGTDAATDPSDLAMACGGAAPATLDDWENCYQKRKCEWEVGCVTEDQFASVQDCMASADAV